MKTIFAVVASFALFSAVVYVAAPVEAENSYLTFKSRIRKDYSNDKALNMWVVSDNLLKGAALNTVQIAERLIKDYHGK